MLHKKTYIYGNLLKEIGKFFFKKNRDVIKWYKMNFIWPIPFSILSTLIMTASIQLFRSVHNYCQILGVTPKSQSNRKISINFRNLIPIFLFLTGCISSCAYFLFEADTILKKGNAFYAFISSLCILYILFVQIWQMPNTLKLIANFEEFIEKSKYLTNTLETKEFHRWWHFFKKKNSS